MQGIWEDLQDSDCELDDDFPVLTRPRPPARRRLAVDCRLAARDDSIHGTVACPRLGASVDVGACSLCAHMRGLFVEEGAARAEVACDWPPMKA